MANEGCCAACQAMLAMERPIPRGLYSLHADGESFQRSIDSGCPICLMIQAEIGASVPLLSICWVITDNSHSANTWSLCFKPALPSISWSLEEFVLQPWNEFSTTRSSDELTSNNTGSDQSFEFLISKYNQCRKGHAACSKTTLRHYLPMRLLDVGDQAHKTLSLVLRDHVGLGALYITLSHCWGDLRPLKLTTYTEPMLRMGIPDSRLPKTFQDAVRVARKLNIRYLWIDSLCIFQDDLDGWAQHAVSMQNIYEHAALNVAATAAPDGSFGIFYDRDPLVLKPLKLKVAWFGKHANHSNNCQTFVLYRSPPLLDAINASHLNRRGWVMQERLLSRRIVHYTKDLLYWECNETFAGENGVEVSALEDPERPHRGTRVLRQMLNSHQPYKGSDDLCKLLYRAWNGFIIIYTGCQLTFEEDKLVALGGIASRMSTLVKDELVAGLWRSRFIAELCWFTYWGDDPEQAQIELKPWLAPSWSWVSVDLCVCPREVVFADHVRDLASLVSLVVNAKPSGALIDGFVKLRCRLVSALLDVVQQPGGQRNRVFFEDVETRFDEEGVVLLDGPHSKKSVDIRLLMLQEGEIGPCPFVAGIALVPSTSQANAFERVGYFHGHYSAGRPETSFYGTLYRKYQSAEDQIIKIV